MASASFTSTFLVLSRSFYPPNRVPPDKVCYNEWRSQYYTRPENRVGSASARPTAAAVIIPSMGAIIPSMGCGWCLVDMYLMG